MNNAVVNNNLFYILSSYKYDDRFTDANCAWYTVYTIWNEEDGEVTVQCGTGWGETLADKGYTNVVPFPSDNEELSAKLSAYREKCFNDSIDAAFAQYSKEVDEYNKILRPQYKGQVVEIMGGRRKGMIARISWLGKGKKFGFDASAWYSKAYPMAAALLKYFDSWKPYTIPAKDCDLIRVFPLDGGEPFYINIDKAKVVEGYVPVTLTREDCAKSLNGTKDFSQKWNNGYDSKSYVA